MSAELVENYRRLVGALLEHSTVDHEGTELAVADFLASDDRAAPILRMVRTVQMHDQSGANGVDLGQVSSSGHWVAGADS